MSQKLCIALIYHSCNTLGVLMDPIRGPTCTVVRSYARIFPLLLHPPTRMLESAAKQQWVLAFTFAVDLLADS